MDPRLDFDRELAAAINVDPPVNFTARVHARIAAEPPVTRSSLPFWVVPAFTFALLAIAVANLPVWMNRSPTPAEPAVLPHRDLVVVSSLPAAMPATLRDRSRGRTTVTVQPDPPAPRVLIAASEMRELQRLFSGAILAPAIQEAVADELSIPPLTIDPIVPFPSNVEGERQ
jgi:hypothetical protein